MREHAVITIASSKPNVELTSLRGNNYLPVLEEGHSSTSHFSGSRKSMIPFSILGHDLSYLPDGLKFIICSTGVFLFFLIYGYMQELIFSLPGFGPFGWYLTLIQFGCYAFTGTLEAILLRKDAKRRVPMRTYALLAFLTVATIGLSNTSVGYLNYPTQVIFKCCKLIPVMIGGILIQGKQYTRLDFTACVCMSFGLIFFTLADSEVSPNFNHTGVILISLALCADAVIGNVQEKAMVMYDAPNGEVVLYSYAIGFVYILCGLLISGGFFEAFYFCLQNPLRTYGYAILFSLSGYFGISYVLTLVRVFGALVAVTVTTCRKAVTIVLSFIFFTKPFTVTYVWAGVIVLFGIGVNIYEKNKSKINWMLLNMCGSCIIKISDLFNSPKKKVFDV